MWEGPVARRGPIPIAFRVVLTTKDTKSTKASENETFDAILEFRAVEVDQQAGLDAGRLHVCRSVSARAPGIADTLTPANPVQVPGGPRSHSQSPGSTAHRIPSFVSLRALRGESRPVSIRCEHVIERMYFARKRENSGQDTPPPGHYESSTCQQVMQRVALVLKTWNDNGIGA